MAITTAFLLKFKTFKTEGVGINSLQTFQSFLKSWVSQKPADLESYFTTYSHDEPVITRIVLATATERAALVLPGVHPGPFFPVGSYNVSELIFHELRKNGITPMVLHGVGGHERNLPTNELAKQYAAAIASAVASPGAGQQRRKDEGAEQIAARPDMRDDPGVRKPGHGVPLQRAIQHRRPRTRDNRRGGLSGEGARGSS